MAHTPVRCEHDSVKWFPRVTVEKYSPDQSAWAQRRLHEELSWGRRLLVETLGIRVPGCMVTGCARPSASRRTATRTARATAWSTAGWMRWPAW